MEKEEFSKIMKNNSKKIGILLNEEQVEQFYIYMELLLEWNKKINLTAITNPEEIILKHFIDSLTIAKEIEKNAKIVDVGTGAGFPGVPLKIIRRDIEITLLDSLNKRILFLQEVIQQLKLTKVEVIHSRVEDFGKDKKYRDTFDYSVSRAVANLAILTEYLIPLVRLKGYCICMKGANVEEEIQQSKNAITILGGKIDKIDKFQLPDSDMDRNIIKIQKIKSTPLKYPRKAGMPAKSPIR